MNDAQQSGEAAKRQPKGGGSKSRNLAALNSAAESKVVKMASPAESPIPAAVGPAYMKRRHWSLISTFVLAVIAPFAVVVLYLWFAAVDQYSSVTGFTIRQEEGGNAAALLGGIAQLTGSATTSDGDILYEFIHSQALVRMVEERVGVIEHYSAYSDRDPVFTLKPEPSIEDLERYWNRIVSVSYDQGSGLMEVRVLAFTPEKAQDIAAEIVRQSQDMINDLNSQARDDAMRYARRDLDESMVRLKKIREALTSFRTRTRIVDPAAGIQGRMGVINRLQQQLAEAMIANDLLQEDTQPEDPRLVQARRRIDVIRARISEERDVFTSTTTADGRDGDDYPILLAEFEGLMVEREFSEQAYHLALASLDLARAKASRQSRYLAVFIQPTLAQNSEYPLRFTLMGIIGLCLLLTWSVLALVYYSIRDRS